MNNINMPEHGFSKDKTVSTKELYDIATEAYNSNMVDYTTQRKILNIIVENTNVIEHSVAMNIMKPLFPNPVEKNIYLVEDIWLKNNLYGYRQMLWNKLCTETNYTISVKAVDKLNMNYGTFTHEYTLYQTPNSSLNVAGILKAIGYALDVADVAFGSDVSKHKQGLLLLKGVERIVSNQQQDTNNFYENLGYGVEVLAEILKYSESDKNTKNTITGISALINLTIDFFTKG